VTTRPRHCRAAGGPWSCPVFAIDDVIGIRGDRLALTTARISDDDDSAATFLLLVLFGDGCVLLERAVQFDIDDVGRATAELDRLAQSIGYVERTNRTPR
jgi:hypothetical protein